MLPIYFSVKQKMAGKRQDRPCLLLDWILVTCYKFDRLWVMLLVFQCRARRQVCWRGQVIGLAKTCFWTVSVTSLDLKDMLLSVLHRGLSSGSKSSGEDLLGSWLVFWEMLFKPPQTKFGGYTGVTLSVCASQNLVRGITSKVLKLINSNFIHRWVIFWRSALYKDHNYICTVFKRLELQTRKNQGLFGKGLKWR